jgi:hypothetical protein
LLEALVACAFQIAELRILANTDSVSLAQRARERWTVHKRYTVDLTAEERERLLAFISKGKASASALLKAHLA